MSTICLHTAVLFRLTWCVCVCVCERERERRRAVMCLCVFVFTHSIYEHLCMFMYMSDPGQGHCQIIAHILPDCQSRTTQFLHLNAQKQQTNLSHIACSCTETGLCLTSKKVESLEAQRRSALAQCLVSYYIQRLMFE